MKKNIVNFSIFDILLVSSIFVQCSRPIYKYLYKYIYSYKESILLVQFCVGSPKKDQTEIPISSYNLLTTNDMQVNSS